jgi:tRNA uridine 5-carboxymethylaminomethyl modification enzyme
MPCNPSIGGPAKGHIVAEIDALGGEMARAIDRTAIQIRLLNASKGPAVQALRAQADKTLYSMVMKEALELQPGVELRQESATRVNVEPVNGRPRVASVETDFGNLYRCGAAVVTAGTFLRGSMIAGEWRSSGGRAGESDSGTLAMSIGDVGIRLRRLKTGTPPRIDARTINFTLTEEQPGSETPLWFSREGRTGQIERVELPPLSIYPSQSDGWRRQLGCYHVETNETGHQLIVANVDRSPMYNGAIEGVGPRYCPSIEDKVMRFRHKTSHGLFLEPEGWRTTEVYVQGCNTSLPHDVQLAFLRTIPALREARITRYGYAVEYDAVDPTELTPWFASKRVDGLFLAGQVNGTSGYEEAAGQGVLAGVNAARFVAGLEPLTLRRDEAYVGVMADDLTTQEFIEPYRMLTSRAEHRLHLRADNADFRLATRAHAAGLISDDRFADVERERGQTRALLEVLDGLYLSPNNATNESLSGHGLPTVARSMTIRDYARRTDVDLRRALPALAQIHAELKAFVDLDAALIGQVEIHARYHSYVEKQQRQIERARKMEDAPIPSEFEYGSIVGLRNEAREKLTEIRPATVGQATRIAGVTPSDVAVLLVQLRRIEIGAMMPALDSGAKDADGARPATVG